MLLHVLSFFPLYPASWLSPGNHWAPSYISACISPLLAALPDTENHAGRSESPGLLGTNSSYLCNRDDDTLPGRWMIKRKKIWVVCLEQTRPTVSVLASNCGCNKLLRTYWLKTTAICYLIVLEHRSPKIKVSAGLGSFWRLHRKIRFLICTGIWRPPAVLGFFLLLLGPRFCHHISFLDSDPPVSLWQRPGDGIEGPLK